MPLVLTNPANGEPVEMTEENTWILFFRGKDLDHVLVETDDDTPALIVYDMKFIAFALGQRRFPMMYYHHRPEWAIARRATHDMSDTDLDRLLDD